jgi:hypothetical protein
MKGRTFGNWYKVVNCLVNEQAETMFGLFFTSAFLLKDEK